MAGASECIFELMISARYLQPLAPHDSYSFPNLKSDLSSHHFQSDKKDIEVLDKYLDMLLRRDIVIGVSFFLLSSGRLPGIRAE